MFEIIIMLLLILSNFYIGPSNYIYYFFIEHYQLIIHMSVMLIYAFLNNDFNIINDSDYINYLEKEEDINEKKI